MSGTFRFSDQPLFSHYAGIEPKNFNRGMKEIFLVLPDITPS